MRKGIQYIHIRIRDSFAKQMVNTLKSIIQKKPLLTAGVIFLIAFALSKVLKSDQPETRAHIPLQEIIPQGIPDGTSLLNYFPDYGVEQDLVDSLTAYIVEATGKDLPPEKARSRAKSFILGSVLFDVPLDMIVGHAQCESNFGTAGLGQTTHNPLNTGNTDAGGTRVFTSFELGILSAIANLAGRIYHYKHMFPEREGVDYTAIWLNQDQKTGIGFLPDQINYKQKNPKRSKSLNPYGAYMSDANGPTRIYEKIGKLSFIDTTYRIQERIATMPADTFYYEKSVHVDEQIYHAFSYITSGGESVGTIRKQLADQLQVPAVDITVMPYDHSRDKLSEEDKIVPRAGRLIYGIYITTQ